MRALRITAATLTIFTTAIFSHLIAGGLVEKPTYFLSHLFLTIFIIQLLLSKNLFEGPTLAFAILVSHGSAHFVIGGNSSSSIKMTFSHLLVGIACYQIFKKIDTIILYLENQINILLVDFKLPKLKALEICFNYFPLILFTQNLLLLLKFQRAPPLSI